MKTLLCSLIIFLMLCIPVSAGVRLSSTTSVSGGTIYCFESPNGSGGNYISCVFVPKDICRK